MASPSSSCEVVDLALAASCDDASSKLFFSRDGGGDLSWPAAAGISSALTDQKSLVALCGKYGVPRELKPVCADTLRCGVCETPPEGSNALCIYSDALEAGLRFPLHDFYLKLLRHYRLAPSQLGPNAWKYMAAFVLRCKDAGVEPLVSAFRYFFSVYTHKRQDKPLGWHYFKPCAGRRLFTGTLHTKYGWKSRFFFLKSPQGMPWKCPVAWGKPRMEDARTVELTDAAINKLMQMPCIDLKYFLSLDAPPVGALTLLQLHSTTAPMMKPESAAASAQALALTSVHQLHAALEAGARAPSAAGEGGDSTRRKRRCPGLGPASVTVTPPTPQRFAISGAPPLPLQGMGSMTPCETSFDGAWGDSDISMPPGIWPSDALCMYDAMVGIDAEVRLQDKEQETDAKAAQQIAHLQDQLRQANAVNEKFMDYLVAARAENAQLKEKYASEMAKLNQEHASEVTNLNQEHASEIAKLNQEHASEVTKLQDEHHKASTVHAEKVKAERMVEMAKLQEEHAAEVAKLNQAHDAAVAWLMEEHEVEVARVKHTAEEVAVDVVQDAKDIVLALFPDLDASLLFRS
ncbi:hypothetical protein BDA96_01G043900 [Sorghum bicolor]|uniref:Transposase (putative) gypsy type domain-containing protein n=1 Tax=Sorghum bicolor TaxID=4558 RepID=A0A921UW19_SORBI|nr:hypothetical protein BDA96_01G043900 [Sorghum bicolor]